MQHKLNATGAMARLVDGCADELYKVKLPSTISECGQDLIRDAVNHEQGLAVPDNFNLSDYIVGRGRYCGKVTARLAKWIREVSECKANADMLEEVGNIASAHCERVEREYQFEITQRINWRGGNFGDLPESCVVNNCNARSMILCAGGGAVLFYRDEFNRGSFDGGLARCWIVPVGRDFSVEDKSGCSVSIRDGLILFNGYGLECLAIARIVSELIPGAVYQKIELKNQGTSGGTLWINSGNKGKSLGYLVSTCADVLRVTFVDMQIADSDTYLHLYEHIVQCCCRCHNEINDSEWQAANDYIYCQSCFEERFFVCESCEETTPNDNLHTGTDGCSYCESCFDSDFAYCAGCNEVVERVELVETEYFEARRWGASGTNWYEFELLCTGCAEVRSIVCDICERRVTTSEGERYAKRGARICEYCRPEYERSLLSGSCGDAGMCDGCAVGCDKAAGYAVTLDNQSNLLEVCSVSN